MHRADHLSVVPHDTTDVDADVFYVITAAGLQFLEATGDKPTPPCRDVLTSIADTTHRPEATS